MLSTLLKHKQALFLLFSVLFFSSCATRYKEALFTSKTDAIADTLKTVHVVNDKGPKDLYYHIKPADLLVIKNLQNVEFGSQNISTGGGSGPTAAPSSFYVEQDGNVILPVIGKVQVGGLTRREATQKVQELYEKKLLKDPIIELSVINLKVTLLGEFKAQGNYLLEKDYSTVIDILGQAGGLTERADPKRLKIIRGDRSNPEIIYANLKDINSLASPKLILQNNDILYLEPKNSASERFQTIMTYAQPVLLILNTIVILNNIR
ncbi:MAG TPA: polysaccharide biosynthesis/export family protein [Pedobacter sp.]|jgi:polysaccharide export outer membrane protein